MSPDMFYRAWKGGFFRDAAQERIALVFPDTSPRGAGIEGEEKDGDFGTGATPLRHVKPFTHSKNLTGAGFYINASKPEYAKHYNMYKFIVNELPSAINSLGLHLVRTPVAKPPERA